jgi:hypothetical protein
VYLQIFEYPYSIVEFYLRMGSDFHGWQSSLRGQSQEVFEEVYGLRGCIDIP